jgi:predicted ATPase
MDNASFGKLLRDYRVAKGLTQEALAELAAMSVNGISALERGANAAPQRKTLELLVAALALPPEEERRLEEAASRPSRPRTDQSRSGRSGVPRALTPFFGREDAIAAASDLISERPLVTLTGAGGVGKTRLALKVAENAASSFRDGVVFLDLAPLRDPDTMLWAFAARFGVKPSRERFGIEELAEAVSGKATLLIVDNCEHLVGAVAPLVEALARSCPGLRILATSRQPLGIPGEQIFRVPSLESDTGVELFIERARRIGGAIEFSDDDRHTIARIVSRLDGIALAIELAAARMNLLALPQLEEGLSERFHILSGSSTLLPRQKTMRATMDWSYDLLESNERHVFRCLWVFSGSFSLDAALAVCADDSTQRWHTFEALASLVDKSLLESLPEGNVQRYRLLETTRAYAMERSTDPEETELIHRRYAGFYVRLAGEAAETFVSAESTTAWAHSLEPDLENFRCALDWTLRSDVDAAARVLFDLQELWIAQGLAAEAVRQAHRILEMEPELSQESQAGLWLTIARLRQELFVHPRGTLEAASNARRLYEGLPDRAGLALAIRQEAAAHMRLGDYARSREEFDRSLTIYTELGDRRMVARCLGYLASLMLVQGDYAQARAALLDSLQMERSTGDDRMIPTVIMNIAETEFAMGDHAAAAERAGENLKRAAIQKASLAHQQANYAVYLLALGRIEEARKTALASMNSSDGSFIAVPLQHLAASIADTDPITAAKILGYVEEVFEKTAFSREFTERYSYDYLTSALRTALGDATLAVYRVAGAAMNENEVLELSHLVDSH